MTKAVLVTACLAGTLALSSVRAGPTEKCPYTTQECLNAMAAKMQNSGWIGVVLDRDKDENWVVKEVVPGSPAQRAGIHPGDTLHAMNGIPLRSENEMKLQKIRKDFKPGGSVTYTVRRDGGSRDLTMTLAPMPADLMAKYIGAHMLEHAAQDMAASKDPKAK
jgi:C-terminal processing protease CtpA/Prc